jgi:predicted peptidase
MMDTSVFVKYFFAGWLVIFSTFLLSCKKGRPGNTVQDSTRITISPYSLTAKSTKVSEHINGLYEYLPEGYLTDGAGTKYPLLIFFHGAGERGQTYAALSNLLLHGPLKFVKNGTFPSSFTVNSTTYKFIIIAPQFTSTEDAYPAEIDQLIDNIKQNYRVDDSRIYLTGMSFGGGLIWNYVGNNADHAKKIAAIVPVAAYINESRQAFHVNHGKAQAIANSNLPVWSTHNKGDNICPLLWTVNVHNILKSLNQTPLPKLTVFNADSHEGWTQTYDPSFKENGMNIYEWMLQNHR